MEFIFGLVSSPLFWLVAFMSKMIFQFLLAQKLRHPHAWFAFLPILSGIQWFQLGHRSGWNLCWVFLPFVGLFVYLYKWFSATIRMCERAGERGSFSVLCMVPYVNTIAIMRLAFKTGFWVKTSVEEKLINQVIKGLESGHKEGELQAFATSHGINLNDFEEALDKAKTIIKNSLKLSFEKYSMPVWINVGVGILWIFGSFIIASLMLTVGIGNLVAGSMKNINANAEKVDEMMIEDRLEVDEALIEKYSFLMAISSVEDGGNSGKDVRLFGEIMKGSVDRESKLVYLLDESFELLEVVERSGYAFGGGKGTLSVSDRVDRNLIAYAAMTEKLQSLNALFVSRAPLLIIKDSTPLTSNSNISDITAELRVSELRKSDGLYIYNQDRELIGAAKIQAIVPLGQVDKDSSEVVEPTTRVKLRVELARKNMTGARYLTTLKDLNSFDEYLDLVNN